MQEQADGDRPQAIILLSNMLQNGEGEEQIQRTGEMQPLKQTVVVHKVQQQPMQIMKPITKSEFIQQELYNKGGHCWRSVLQVLWGTILVGYVIMAIMPLFMSFVYGSYSFWIVIFTLPAIIETACISIIIYSITKYIDGGCIFGIVWSILNIIAILVVMAFWGIQGFIVLPVPLVYYAIITVFSILFRQKLAEANANWFTRNESIK